MTIHHSAKGHSADSNLAASRKRESATSAFSIPLVLLLIAVLALSACGGGSGSAGDSFASSNLATVSVLPATSTIVVGSTEQLEPTAKDQNGNVMPGINFTFSSSSAAATVSQAGLVRGVSAGTATISVSAGEKSTSVTITVTAPQPVLTQISVSPSTASILAGQSQTYTAVGYDEFNNLMSGIVFTWASDGNGSVATLNGNVATGVSPGNIHITASASGISSMPAMLTVLPPPPILTSLIATPAAPSIFAGGTQQLTAMGYDQNGNQMTGLAFVWASYNPGVATVDAS